MPYRIAGIDVHKKMLAVVIADVAVEGEYQFDAAAGRHQPRVSCAGSPTGLSSARSRKW